MIPKDKSKILILIADDEVNLLLLLKDNLEEIGYEVITASNGEEALQKSALKKPDAIVLDVEMPKMNGFQVCEKLRHTSGLERVPILILSAYVQPEDIRKGLSAGANRYMIKPFRMKELIESLQQLLSAEK